RRISSAPRTLATRKVRVELGDQNSAARWAIFPSGDDDFAYWCRLLGRPKSGRTAVDPARHNTAKDCTGRSQNPDPTQQHTVRHQSSDNLQPASTNGFRRSTG